MKYCARVLVPLALGCGLATLAAASAGGPWNLVRQVAGSAGNPQLSGGDYTSAQSVSTPFASTMTAGGFTLISGYLAEMPGGCDLSVTVKKAGGDYASIQDALDHLSKNLTMNTCVVIRDTATYSESVTVEGFTFSSPDYTLAIMADPSFISSAPVVIAPTAAAAFWIKNSQVSLANITIVATNTVNYGILASSADVMLSNISVQDSGGNISVAGISLSSHSALNFSSVTVQNAYGLWLTTGAIQTGVFFSTVQANDFGLYLTSASSNSVVGSSLYGSGPGGAGAYLDSGSNYNSISQSTMVGSGYGLYLAHASSDTTAGCYMQGSTAVSVAGSTGTIIAYSMLASPGAGGIGLKLSQGSVNLTLSSSTVLGGIGGSAISLDPGNTGSIVLYYDDITGPATAGSPYYGLLIATQAGGPPFTGLSIASMTFMDPLPAGTTAIDFLGGTFLSTFTSVGFNSANIGTNINASALNTGTGIYMVAILASARTGPQYADDPYGYIIWPGFHGWMAPANGVGVSTTMPVLAWSASAGPSHMQLSSNPGFTTGIIADLITTGSFFASTHTLSQGSTYWWRVLTLDSAAGWELWSATSSFVVDLGSPTFLSPKVSTDTASGWTSLPSATYFAAPKASVQVTVQDPLSGLLVSTGLPAGLVGQWHFDESSGSVVLDASPNANDGALANAPSRVAGKRGGALSFNGSSSYVSLKNKSNLFASNPLTIEAWVYPTSLNQGGSSWWGTAGATIIDGNESWYASGYILSIYNDGRLHWAPSTVCDQYSSCYPWSGQFSNRTIPLNQWTHVALVYDGINTSMYLNGAMDSSVNNNAAPSTPSFLKIGAQSWIAGYFKGSLDEVRLFNAARSAAQISADYESDTLAAHNRGAAYNVSYTNDGGATWNFVSTQSVTLTGSGMNGDTSAETLEADNISLVTSTGPGAATNQVAFSVSDYAGNVSTAVYVVLVQAQPSLVSPSSGAYVSTSTPKLTWNSSWGGNFRMRLSQTQDFSKVIADSITASQSYVSTNVLTNAATYWWKVQIVGSGDWSAAFSFVVDTVTPAFSDFYSVGADGSQVPETGLSHLLGGVTAQITVQDVLSGLKFVSSGGSLPAGLVGLWHFDAGSGATASDDSGNGHNGTLVNGPTWVSGKYGDALNFNGSNRVDMGNLGSFPTRGTIEFWMNSSQMANYPNALTTQYNGDNGTIRCEEHSDGYFACYAGSNHNNFSGVTYFASGMQTGVWYHIAFVWDTVANSITGYLNGQSVGSASNTYWPSSIPDFTVGSGFDTSRNWIGSIDEVRLYNVALSQADIQADMQANSPSGPSYSVQYSTNAGQTGRP